MKSNRHIIAGLLFFIALLLPLAAKQALQWFWKIDGEVYTQKQFEQDYDSYLVLASSQMNLPLYKLKFYLEPESGDDEHLQKLRARMSREKFAKNYKTVLLVNRLAEEEGYFDQPRVAAKREFFLKYFSAELYLMEYLEKNMPVVTESEVMDRWIKERKNDPKLRKVTVKSGLKWAREKVEREKRAELKNKILQDIRGKYKLEENLPVASP